MFSIVLWSSLEDAFRKMDSSGRGQLEESDLARALRRLDIEMSPQALRELLNHLDANGDGIVSMEEWLGFLDRVETRSGAKAVSFMLRRMQNNLAHMSAEAAEDERAAREKAAGWTFFIFALSRYGRKGIDAPGESDLWAEYQMWRDSDKAKEAVDNALVGSPETIREKLWQFQKSHVDQVILLNQAGKTSHQDICESLEMFAKEVMPEFTAEEPAHQAWKQDVLDGKIVLEDLDTQPYDLYSHQNEDIIRMSPEELKALMAAKEAEQAAAGDD